MSTLFGSVSFLSNHVSDPSFQLSRLRCIDRDHFVVCDKDQLFLGEIDSSQSLVVDEYVDSGNVSRCHSYGVRNCQNMAVSNLRSNLQSLCLFGKSDVQQNVAAVNSHGDLVVCPISEGDENRYKFGSANCSKLTAPGCYGVGFVSLCNSDDRLVSSHFLSKSLLWSDINTLAETRRISLYQNPTCVISCSQPNCENSLMSPSLAVVCEGGNISVYDERQSCKGGCVHRENEHKNGVLWDVLALPDNNRLVGAGNEGHIRIYDNRMWKTISRWRAPHKFDIVKLLPSSNNQLQLYAAGRDNEVLLCDLESHVLTLQSRKASRLNVTKQIDVDDSEPPHKIAKMSQDRCEITDKAKTKSDNFVQHSNLLPMQLPSSSKLRISHHRGVRAEFIWSGLDIAPNNNTSEGDRIIGLCGHGKLYVVDKANLMKVAV